MRVGRYIIRTTLHWAEMAILVFLLVGMAIVLVMILSTPNPVSAHWDGGPNRTTCVIVCVPNTKCLWAAKQDWYAPNPNYVCKVWGTCSAPPDPATQWSVARCGWPSGVSGSLSPAPWNTTKACTNKKVCTSLPAPTVSGSANCGTPGNSGWCRGGLSIGFSGNEPLSGETITNVESSGGVLCGINAASGSCSYSPGSDGSFSLTYWAHSSYGDSTGQGSVSWKLDATAPSVNINLSGTKVNGAYNPPVGVSCSGGDGTSGFAGCEVRVDGGSWVTSTSISSGGAHTIEARAYDVAGNKASTSTDIQIDGVPPSISVSIGAGTCLSGQHYQVSGAITDKLSGVSKAKISYPGATKSLSLSGKGGWSYLLPIYSFNNGKSTVKVSATDGAGNSATASTGILVDNSPPTVSLQGSWESESAGALSVSDVGTGLSWVKLDFSDGDGLSESFDLSAGAPPASIALGDYLPSYSAYAPQTVNATVSAKDKCGNTVSASGTITFPKKPFISLPPIFKPQPQPKEAQTVDEPEVELPDPLSPIPYLAAVGLMLVLGLSAMMDPRPNVLHSLAAARDEMMTSNPDAYFDPLDD